jgi:hypothetical protein
MRTEVKMNAPLILEKMKNSPQYEVTNNDFCAMTDSKKGFIASKSWSEKWIS